MALRVTTFEGLAPKIAPRNLGNNQAQIANNCKLWSGEIEPMKDSLLLYISSKEGPFQSAIRLTADNGSDVYFAWDVDVNAVRGPIAGDTSQRIYYTGDGEPRVTNLTLGTIGGGDNYPSTFFVLGIPQPATPPTVTPTGGVGADTSRVYAWTYLSRTTLPNGNSLDEEGAPSPVTLATGKVDDVWGLTNIEGAPPNSGSVVGVELDSPIAGQVRVELDTVRYLRVGETIRFQTVGGITDLNATFTIVGVNTETDKIWVTLDTNQVYTSGGSWARIAPHKVDGMKKRIYRTDAVGVFRFVAEIPAGQVSYDDTLTDALLALRPQLETTDFYMPPANMHSLIELPNGVLVGISDNQIVFSEPYQPHAYPTRYRKTANYPGVSLGNVGTMVVMTTTARHYVCNGVDPSVVTLDESRGRAYPCISKRGTVSTDQGVVWPTHDGLAIQTTSGSLLFTEGIFEFEEWQALNPSGLFAAFHSGRYMACFKRVGSEVQEMLILDPSEKAFVTTAGVQASGLYGDLQTGQLYILLGSRVRQWDSDTVARLTADWQSKDYVLPFPMNLGAAKLDADFRLTPEEQAALAAARQAVIDANQAIIDDATDWIGGAVNDAEFNRFELNGGPLNIVPAANFDQLWFYEYAINEFGTMELIFAKQLTTPRAFTLPAGFKSDVYSFRIRTNLRVRAMVVGKTMTDLRTA